MSLTKFTPKPWNLTVENTEDGNIHIDICDNSGHFVGLVVNNANIGVEEALANANLMHAAPDMYEALGEMCRYCYIAFPKRRCEHCNIRLSMQKARGEIGSYCDANPEFNCSTCKDKKQCKPEANE